ncbi:MAG: dynamin family protein [Xenococcus sp. (in: cyanobacteria)]
MAIDRNILREVSAKIPAKQDNRIACLPRGIHRLPELRDWVTFETVALAPIPVLRLGEWGIISLLSVIQKNEDGTQGYKTPWAVVEWSLNTMKVVKKIDLRPIKANNPLWQSKIIINQPADNLINLTPQIRTIRENALFSTLDAFCDSSMTDLDFAQLAKHYSGLLPKEFYIYYHDLVPESKHWLVADIPAISLEAITANVTKNNSNHTTVREPEATIKLPHDLTNNLSIWFNTCNEIADSLSSENQELGKEISTLLEKINKKRLLPGFRLAFIGEFSRGKSFLINRLLDRDILPEGALPTTATLTSIMASSKEQMEVRVGEKIDIRPLEKSSWDEILATDQAGSDNEVFAGVRISLENEWLRSLDAEIIDTPGAGDLNEKRANLVLDVLNQCDAAILLISATSPLSMTEAAFLEQEVIGRHVPRIMVAVSKLDMIPLIERKKMMQSIKHRIESISSTIPILPTYPIEESQKERDVLVNIAIQIKDLVAQGERCIWRSHQIGEQLIDWLSCLIEITKRNLSTMQMNEEERKRSFRQAEMEIEKADLYWDNLQIELDRRRLKWTKTTCHKIVAHKEELMENLEYELQRTSDLKTWWERDLPFRLRRELIILSRKSESFLLNFLAQDVEWLEQEIVNLFQITLKQKVVPSQSNKEIDFKVENREITDIQKYRLFTRIGSTATMIAGSIFGGPIGIAASTGLLLASEQYLKKELDSQREFLFDDLKRIVETSIDKYCQQVSERLYKLYQEIIKDLQNEQSTWKYAKKAVLQNRSQTETFNEQNYQQIIKDALTLKEEIEKTLSI